MMLLGKKIKEILSECSAYIISSAADRALCSAKVLSCQLGLDGELEPLMCLWTRYKDPNLDEIMGLVNGRREKADGLIMMTHLEVTEKFPEYFLKKELGQERYIGHEKKNKYDAKIKKGEAVHFDLEKKNISTSSMILYS